MAQFSPYPLGWYILFILVFFICLFVLFLFCKNCPESFKNLFIYFCQTYLIILISLSVSLCVCVCLSVCMCAGAHMPLRTWRSDDSTQCWSLSFTLLGTGSPGFVLFCTVYTSIAGSQALGSPVSHSHLPVEVLELQMHDSTSCFVWVLGLWIWILCVPQGLSHWIISPALGSGLVILGCDCSIPELLLTAFSVYLIMYFQNNLSIWPVTSAIISPSFRFFQWLLFYLLFPKLSIPQRSRLCCLSILFI